MLLLGVLLGSIKEVRNTKAGSCLTITLLLFSTSSVSSQGIAGVVTASS